MIYLIGSLRNPEVPEVAKILREQGLDVFDDWYAAGPEADDKWREYEIARGRSYIEALSGAAARNVFHFDRTNLEQASAVCLVLPAGKSGHLELGFSLGRGKPGYVLLDNPDRWDVMYQFATMVTDKLEDIIEDMKIDRSILYICEVCQKPIKAGMAMTNFKTGEAHYECWEEYVNAKSVQQISPRFSCECSICRPT